VRVVFSNATCDPTHAQIMKITIMVKTHAHILMILLLRCYFPCSILSLCPQSRLWSTCSCPMSLDHHIEHNIPSCVHIYNNATIPRIRVPTHKRNAFRYVCSVCYTEWANDPNRTTQTFVRQPKLVVIQGFDAS
jgi:hypothetical protein